MSMHLLFFPSMLMFLSGFMLFWGVSFYWMWLSMEIISLSVSTMLLMSSGYERGFLSYKKSSIMLKYFMVQFFAGASLLSVFYFISSEDTMSKCIFFLLLSLKLSLVPFHSWVLDIFSGMSIIECYIMSVIPKVSPLVLMANYTFEYSFLLGIISVVGSAALGLMYSDIRHIFACSSIMTTGWLCIVSSGDLGVFFMCYFMYSSLSLVMLVFMGKVSMISLLESFSSLMGSGGSYKAKMMLSLMLFSYISLPFFLTFILKLMIIVVSSWYVTLGFMIIVSSVSIIMYSRIIVNVWSYDDVGLLVWVKSDFSSGFLLSLLVMLVSALSMSLLIMFM